MVYIQMVVKSLMAMISVICLDIHNVIDVCDVILGFKKSEVLEKQRWTDISAD
jgi:hypothetical protein